MTRDGNSNNRHRKQNRKVNQKDIAENVVEATPDMLKDLNIKIPNPVVEDDESAERKNNNRRGRTGSDNKREKSCYASKNRNKLGNNWNVTISDYDIKFKAAPKMVRDLSFFNVDPMTDGIYYKDQRLLQAMMSLTYSKVYYYTTLVTAMQMMIETLKVRGPYDQEIETILLDVRNKLLGWTIIENGLQQLVINPDYVGVITNVQIQLRENRCTL